MRSTLNSIAFAALVPILSVTAAPIGTNALNPREPCEVGVCPDMYGSYESYDKVHVDEKRNAQDDPPPVNLSDSYLACYAAYDGWQHDGDGDGEKHSLEKRDELEKRCGKLKRDPQDYSNYRPVKCYIEYDGGTGGDGGASMEKREEFQKRCGKYIRAAETEAEPVNIVGSYHSTYGSYQSEGPDGNRDAEKRDPIDVWGPPSDPRYDEYPPGPDADKRDSSPELPIDPPRYEWYPPGHHPVPGPDPDAEKRDAVPQIDIPTFKAYDEYHKYGPLLPEKRSLVDSPEPEKTSEHDLKIKRQTPTPISYGTYRDPVCDAGICYVTYPDVGDGGVPDGGDGGRMNIQKRCASASPEDDAIAILLAFVKRQGPTPVSFGTFRPPVCNGGVCYVTYGAGGTEKMHKRNASPEAAPAITPISIPNTYKASYEEYGTEYSDDAGHHLEE